MHRRDREEHGVSEIEWPDGAILGGVVGSTAYGLSHADSDVDRLGVVLASTRELFGLEPPVSQHNSSWHSVKPDVTTHEALKFCRLALNCNPSILELLWLPDELYEVRTQSGNQLIGIRSAFLSRMGVRRAYLGYATQQFQRLKSRGDGSFSADTRKRTEKHARHLLRLLRQGVELHNTGQLTTVVQDPQEYFEFGARVGQGDIELAEQKLRWAEDRMDLHAVRSRLGDERDRDAVQERLIDARRRAIR